MNCRHENIYWEDLFKPEKQNNNNYRHHNAYCLDCNATKGRVFAGDLQRWYVRKVEEWLKSNGLTEKIGDYHSTYQFVEFVEKNNYQQQWNKLCLGKIHENFEGLLGQAIFFEYAKSVEHLCQEFKKEKEQEKPNNPDPEREIILNYYKSNNIKSIKLTNNKLLIKYNHKEEEEEEEAKTSELKQIKKYIQNYSQNNQLSLADLEKTENNSSNSNLPLYLASAVGIGAFILLLIFILTRNNKRR